MDDELKYERIAEVLGRGRADVAQSVLEAEGISVQLIEESASQSSYVTPFAPVQLFVPKADAERARELIRGLDGVDEIGPDEPS